MAGVSGSFLRDDEPATVGRPIIGGGDFSRGDTGHLGVSLANSDTTEGFCGTGARSTGCELEGGGNDGVVAEESCCRGVVDGLGRLVLDLEGLGS